ncbi:MAG: NAD(P)/FAD-dependent oxidoreductase [Solirubrobacterales bacterium]|nr:NAD(P)/FAD-dependent oxidoreductase [Solirubrobacterales bacterium]
MPTRVTTRGPERTSLDGTRADVLICGASFAGLAVARELAGSGARVLLVDRYAIGERATSACAAPTPWLHALGLQDAIRQELPDMTFTTPHGTARYRLPWSWSAFDYRELCRLLFAQTDARFETAKVHGRTGRIVHTDRGELHAPLIVDALGWRRVLSTSGGYQPPDAPLSRGLEVHPHHAAPDDALDVWVDRSLIRSGYGWRVPAAGEQRVGVGSYAPHDHVKEPTVDLAGRLQVDAVRYQGNWFPHRLRAATEPGVFFVGDSAGHCFPLSGEGIRTALYFGIACGRELRAVHAGEQTPEAALRRYHDFSAAHGRAFRRALRLQQALPRIPPRLLTLGLRALGRRWLVDRSFGWYLRQADPSFATAPVPASRTGAPATPVA